MSHTEPEQPVPTGITVSYTSLQIKYLILGLYGVAALIVGIPTIFAVTGEIWGVVLPALMTVTAFAATYGLERTKRGARGGVEFWATLCLFATFCSYSLAIIARTIEDGDVTRLPAALFPVALSILPFSRMASLARKDR